MSYLKDKPNAFRQGQHFPGASDLNRIMTLGTRQLRGGRGINLREYGDRQTINIPKFPVGVSSIDNYFALFVITAISDDWLMCSPLTLDKDSNGLPKPMPYNAIRQADSTEFTPVVKPYSLQRTPWDGGNPVLLNGQSVTFTYQSGSARTATSGTLTENQVIVPDYFLGDIILAAQMPQGYSNKNAQPMSVPGVPGKDAHGNPTPAQPFQVYPDICWVDLNNAGRAWAAVPSTGRIGG